jgi:pimeloyl-ACP methyl ester carboxylesterase
MRGYGDSDKPRGREVYKMERLVDDVHQLIHKLGINLLIYIYF